MKKFVLDTSVIVKWLNKNHEDNIEQADRILRDTQLGKAVLYAPEMAKIEVGNVLFFNKKLTQSEAKIPLNLLYDLPIEFVPLSTQLSKDSYAIASAYVINYSESVFLALSEQERAVLVTESVNKNALETGAKILALKYY